MFTISPRYAYIPCKYDSEIILFFHFAGERFTAETKYACSILRFFRVTTWRVRSYYFLNFRYAYRRYYVQTRAIRYRGPLWRFATHVTIKFRSDFHRPPVRYIRIARAGWAAALFPSILNHRKYSSHGATATTTRRGRLWSTDATAGEGSVVYASGGRRRRIITQTRFF